VWEIPISLTLLSYNCVTNFSRNGMKYIIILLLMIHSLYAAKVTESKWKKGQTFSHYLETNHISKDVLNSISEDDQKFLSEISSNYSFYQLKDENNVLLQALIPISKVMQIHLSKKKNDEGYDFNIIPIKFEENEYFAQVFVKNTPKLDIKNTIHNDKIAEKVSFALSGVMNPKMFHRGDEIDFLYTQDIRVGKPYLSVNVKSIRVRSGKKEKFIYVDEKGYGYATTVKSKPYKVQEKRKITYSKRVPVRRQDAIFGMPLRHARLTSNFSYSRWHPILHQYRPHHGTDFGARRGTPLLAVNTGVISYAGDMGTYGKVVKIRHIDGYESLYAHQSSIRVKRGEHVKKGQVIGYVGNTGRSTGPHLHFGLQKNGSWVDPMTVLRKKALSLTKVKKFMKYENVVSTKYQTVEIGNVKRNKAKLLEYIHEQTPTFVWDKNI